ncbi:MAG: DUF6165 family protein [Chromatiales bacterium]|jgi:hypothetical protein|nr:DUF6165 family protein [Chromatiales bacterium]MDX9767658.1 DUF6165 family protein [Ectothiorhodospiraceae bacterium]
MRDDMLMVPVAWGEVLDKLTILAIKSERIADPAKQANIRREHELLTWVVEEAGGLGDAAPPVMASLKAVNERLWEVEDALRDCEAAQRFDAQFIELARAVYRLNDERFRLKRRLNELLGSALVEEKSYGNIDAA